MDWKEGEWVVYVLGGGRGPWKPAIFAGQDRVIEEERMSYAALENEGFSSWLSVKKSVCERAKERGEGRVGKNVASKTNRTTGKCFN